MNLNEFRGQDENNIIDPNLKRQMQANGQLPNNTSGKRKVTPQQMGFTHEEEVKQTAQDAVLDRLDKVIARKQNEARLMASAIEESDGEGLSKEEFEDILEQNKEFITDEPDGIPMEYEVADKVMPTTREITSSLPTEKPSDLFNDIENEEDDDEDEEVITPEQQMQELYSENHQKESENIQDVEPKKVELNDDPFDHFESGNIDFDSDINDLEDDVDEKRVAEEEQKRQMDRLKGLIKEKISPVTKGFDISTFSIVNKPASNVIAMPRVEKDTIADWVLMSSKKPIYMKKFSGTEIERLANGGKGRTRLNRALDNWQLIYDHIMDKHKPASLEAWAKTVSFLDIDHIYMAIYRANFEGSNYIPYTCPNDKCKDKIFLSDNFNIMDMCKFASKEDKETFNSIIGTETSEANGLYYTEIVPVSDNYAISFREPSIYNIIFESAVLDEDFVEKYGDLISICSYIDSIYLIDQERRELRPVRTNIYPNNMKKTVKARIIAFSKIISTLGSDQYNTLIAYMQKINESGERLTYRIPEATCPTCKTEIPASDSEAQQLVFTRHQLAALATT